MKQKNKKGFTLIELMIVIAIIAIMVAVVLSIDSKGNEKLKLESAAREIVSGLRTAQNNALSGKQNAGMRSCFFEFKPSANSYEIEGEFYDPTTENTCVVPPYYATVRAGELPSGVNIISNYKGNIISNIGFFVPFGEVMADHGIYDSGEPIDKSIRMTVSKSGFNYIICISPSGRIDELGITSAPCDN